MGVGGGRGNSEGGRGIGTATIQFGLTKGRHPGEYNRGTVMGVCRNSYWGGTWKVLLYKKKRDLTHE